MSYYIILAGYQKSLQQRYIRLENINQRISFLACAGVMLLCSLGSLENLLTKRNSIRMCVYLLLHMQSKMQILNSYLKPPKKTNKPPQKNTKKSNQATQTHQPNSNPNQKKKSTPLPSIPATRLRFWLDALAEQHLTL